MNRLIYDLSIGLLRWPTMTWPYTDQSLSRPAPQIVLTRHLCSFGIYGSLSGNATLFLTAQCSALLPKLYRRNGTSLQEKQ